jgi:hypothetical protein
MSDTVPYKIKVGGVVFTADLPRSTKAKSTTAVEIRYLIAFERRVVAELCNCEPTGEGLQFLRTRSRLKVADVAVILGVEPSVVFRYESGEVPVERDHWDRLVAAIRAKYRTRETIRPV